MSLKVNRGRTLARSQALQLLFQGEATGIPLDEVLAGDYLLSKGPLNPYAEALARGCAENIDRIDCSLRAVSTNWNLSRMSSIDRNLLRLAVYEMRLIEPYDGVQDAVVINEAVEIAKAYGTDESPRFVNGVLGNIARAEALPDLLAQGSSVSADDAEAACISELWHRIDRPPAEPEWDMDDDAFQGGDA